MATVQKLVATVRSTRADYNIPNKTKTDLYLQCFDSNLKATLNRLDSGLPCPYFLLPPSPPCPPAPALPHCRFSPTIATLAYSAKVQVTDSPPKGCAIVTVSEKVAFPDREQLNFSL